MEWSFCERTEIEDGVPILCPRRQSLYFRFFPHTLLLISSAFFLPLRCSLSRPPPPPPPALTVSLSPSLSVLCGGGRTVGGLWHALHCGLTLNHRQHPTWIRLGGVGGRCGPHRSVDGRCAFWAKSIVAAGSVGSVWMARRCEVSLLWLLLLLSVSRLIHIG